MYLREHQRSDLIIIDSFVATLLGMTVALSFFNAFGIDLINSNFLSAGNKFDE